MYAFITFYFSSLKNIWDTVTLEAKHVLVFFEEDKSYLGRKVSRIPARWNCSWSVSRIVEKIKLASIKLIFKSISDVGLHHLSDAHNQWPSGWWPCSSQCSYFDAI